MLRSCTLLLLFFTIASAQDDTYTASHVLGNVNGPNHYLLREYTPTGIAISPARKYVIYDAARLVLRVVDEEGIIEREIPVHGGVTGIFAVAHDGMVYARDSFAGPHARILRINLSTAETIPWAGMSPQSGLDGTPLAQFAVRPGSLRVLPDGSLVFANHVELKIQKVTPAGQVITIAGNGSRGLAQENAVAIASSVNGIQDVDGDGMGLVYFIDHTKIFRINPAGRLEKLLDVDELHKQPGFVPAPGSSPVSSPIESLAVSRQGEVYIYDGALRKIIRRDVGGQFTAVVGGGSVAAETGVTASSAKLNQVTMMTVDWRDRLVFHCLFEKQVLRLEGDGRLKEIGRPPPGWFEQEGVRGEDAFGSNITGFDIGPDNTLYFGDEYRIRYLDNFGTVRTLAGTTKEGSACPSGPVAGQSFPFISNLRIDGAGNKVLLAHPAERATGGTVTLGVTYCEITAGGLGRTIVSGDQLSAATGQPNAQFSRFSLDRNGDLLIPLTYRPLLLRVTRGGTVSRLLGDGIGGYSPDGTPASGARILNIGSVAVSPAGLLYFTEEGRIRFVDELQRFSTLNFSFRSASNLHFDAAGRLYFTDDNRLWRLDPNGTLHLVAGNGQSGRPPVPLNGLAASDIALPNMQAPVATSAGAVIVIQQNRVLRLEPRYAPRMSRIDGDSQTGPAGRTLPAPLRVLVSRAGTPLPRIEVTFSVIAGNARLSRTSALTDDEGEIAVQVTLGATPGPVRLRASAEGLEAVEFQLTATAPITGPHPVLFTTGIVGGGLSTPPVRNASPNALMTMYGEDLAPEGAFRAARSADIVNSRLPTVLDGICVEVNGQRAPLHLVSSTQINFVFPDTSVMPPSVRTGWQCDSATPVYSNAVTVPLSLSSPEFLYVARLASGEPLVAAVSAETGEVLAMPGLFAGLATRRARRGEVVQLYAVGLGSTNPSTVPGTIPSAAAPLHRALQIQYANGVTVPISSILYAGLAPGFAGLYQLNWRIPLDAPSALVPLRLLSGEGNRTPIGYLSVD